MSPRKPAVLRDRDGENLREHLISTAARLIDQRGSAGLAVRDIAREAQVADGALYNYFEDKEDLLAQALLAHVGRVMTEAPQLIPEPGTGTVAGNLAGFIDRGLGVLIRVVPAFAGLLAQPNVLSRFHAMVGGGAAFGTPDETAGPAGPSSDEAGPSSGEAGPSSGEAGPAGLPDLLTRYLRAEQRLGRIDPAADVDAASTLIVGAIHGQVLPRVVFATPGEPITFPTGLGAQLADAAVRGLAPR
jgi:AcrR family transcriptional regulator